MMQEEVVQLHFSCRDLPSTCGEGVRLGVSVREAEGYYTEIGQTETVVERINPHFSTGIPIVVKLGTTQRLRVLIYRVDSSSERIVETVGRAEEVDLLRLLTTSQELQLGIQLDTHHHGGIHMSLLMASALVPASLSHGTTLAFAGASLVPPGRLLPAPYFIVQLKQDLQENEAILLYRSEAAHGCESPRWKPFTIPTRFFPAPAEWQTEISVYNFNNNGEDTFLGSFSTTLYQLLSRHNEKFMLRAGSRRSENASVDLVHLQSREDVPCFLNKLKSNLQLHFTIAMDFTANNGALGQPDSLHNVHPYTVSSAAPNPYMKTVETLLPCMGTFDRLGRVSLLGFGAKIPPDFSQVSHLFALNGDLNKPYARGLEEALQLYRNNVISITPYAPAEYSAVIHHTIRLAKASERTQSSFHFVLVILTCGVLKNAQDAIDTLVEASALPISVIFVAMTSKNQRTKNDSSFDSLFKPCLKSSNNSPLLRETAVLAQGPLTEKPTAHLTQKIMATISRHANLLSAVHL